MSKMNQRPEGDSPKGHELKNAGNRSGVTHTYGGGLDKGYQGGMSIAADCKSDKPCGTLAKNKRGK